MDSYVGSIFAFGFNYAPAGWLQCDGRMYNISDYEVLFTLIGTTYGGNGVTTFGVPNLANRVPIGTGQGTGLSNYLLGQSAGVNEVTLTIGNLPAHTHVPTISIPTGTGTPNGTPTNSYFAPSVGGAAYASGTNTQMGATTVNSSNFQGGSVPVSIEQPYQVVNYLICAFGVFPQHP